MQEQKDLLGDALSHSQARSISLILEEFPIVMLSAVYWRNRAPWELQWRTVNDTFFLFPTAGAFEVKLESEQHTVEPGRFLMLPEGERHKLQIARDHSRLEQISVHCHINSRWHLPLLARFSSRIGQLSHRSTWFDQLCRLVALMNSDKAAGQVFGESLLRLLLSNEIMTGNELTPQRGETDSRVESIRQYLQRHYSDASLSVEKAAAEVHLSPVQMRKLFLRYSGVTPKEHLNQIRMLEAARLLRQSILSVKEIAARAGFSSDHYFHLAFRKGYGCTPSEYRNGVSV